MKVCTKQVAGLIRYVAQGSQGNTLDMWRELGWDDRQEYMPREESFIDVPKDLCERITAFTYCEIRLADPFGLTD